MHDRGTHAPIAYDLASAFGIAVPDVPTLKCRKGKAMLPGSICDRIVLMLIAEWRIAEWREGYFLDSRALVKRYVPETGTVWVRTITTPSAGFRR